MSVLSGYGVVARSVNNITVEKLTFQPPGPMEVRMKVQACGLCHSDVSCANGKMAHPLPAVLGHEGAGIIESVGAGVVNWKVGDRAILTLVMPCNNCGVCLDGRPSLCVNKKMNTTAVAMADGKNCFPFTGLGCMADYCVVSHQALIKCPDSMPIEKAALVSCGVTTGCGAAMNRAKCTPGSSCCVVGCGGVGLSAIQGARICGAKQIIAVDMAESKLAAARKMGATHCINPANSTSLVKDIKKLSGGGVDNALECIGLPSTFQTVIDCTKRGGTSVLVGVAGGSDEATFKMNILLGEKNITGSMMGSSVPSVFVPLLCDLYSKGDLLIDELISKFYPLSDAAQAWSELESGANLRGVFVMHELASMAGAQATVSAKI